jgi:hypothetical protein
VVDVALIIKLLQLHTPPAAIISIIENKDNKTNFNFTDENMKALGVAGITQDVLDAMLKAKAEAYSKYVGGIVHPAAANQIANAAQSRPTPVPNDPPPTPAPQSSSSHGTPAPPEAPSAPNTPVSAPPPAVAQAPSQAAPVPPAPAPPAAAPDVKAAPPTTTTPVMPAQTTSPATTPGNTTAQTNTTPATNVCATPAVANCITQPHVGDTTVSGQVAPEDTVAITINGSSEGQAQVNPDGSFIKNVPALTEGGSVKADVTHAKSTTPVTLTAAVAAKNPNSDPPTIYEPLLAKQKVVSGTADKSSTIITLNVYDPACNVADPSQCTAIAYGKGNIDKDGTYAIELRKISSGCPYVSTTKKQDSSCVYGLAPRDFVTVNETIPKAEKPVSGAGPIFVVPDTFKESAVSWGGVTPTFATGFILSQNNGQFSQYHLFLGLTVDNSWHIGSRHRLETFAQGQLTSIPAATCQSSSTTSGMTTGGSTSGSNCLNITTALNSFISSPKAAVIQGGAFFPLEADAWKWSYHGDTNALFIAPVIEGGFQTVTNTTQTTSSSPGNSTTT